MADPLPLVSIQNLSFGYGPQLVLKGINLTVPRGAVVAIMGLSGCGKTTLLRLIGGQIPLQSKQGAIQVNGQELAGLSQAGLYQMRRQIGMMFQFGALFTDLTVFDNVAFPLREHTELSEAMIHDMVIMKLNAVGMRGVHQKKPTELSGGMARRVALARATIMDPALILYDEPFTGLDSIAMGVISRLVRQMNQASGATTILVTHDVQESLKIVDYLYFVADGVIVAQGTPEEIKQSAVPFVHQFIWGEIDGPMHYHYPAQSVQEDFKIEGKVSC